MPDQRFLVLRRVGDASFSGGFVGACSTLRTHADAGCARRDAVGEPTWVWVTQVARNVTADLCDAGIDVKFLLRDRDAKFAPGSDAVWQGEGARILRSPVRAPNANAIAERWVRTVRSECTDRLLIVNERHLRRVLDRYVSHYNQHRPHRGLAMHAQYPRGNATSSTPARITCIRSHEALGGLINEYYAA